MPMLDYKCPGGHQFEQIVSRYEDEVTCKECGQIAQPFMPSGSRKNVRFLFNFMES